MLLSLVHTVHKRIQIIQYYKILITVYLFTERAKARTSENDVTHFGKQMETFGIQKDRG